MSVGKQDLRQFNIVATTTLQNVGELGVGAAAEGVPANMRRYVYYYRAINVDQTVVGTIFESLAGVVTPKDSFMLTPVSGTLGQIQSPPGGFPGSEPGGPIPILSFRASGFIAVQTSAIGGSGKVMMTFGYYDAPPS